MPASNKTPAAQDLRPTAPWHGLIWPQLFLGLSLGVRPERCIAGVLLALALWAAGTLPSMWLDKEPSPLQRSVELGSPVLDRFADALLRADARGAVEAARFLVIDLPCKVSAERPWSTAASLVLALLAWAVMGGAIARSSATEFALREPTSTRDSFSFSLTRLRPTFASLATPLVVATVLAGVVSGLGALAMNPVAGGVLSLGFVAVLLLSLAGVLALLGLALGLPLLVAAVVCEGTDAIDALQRTFAYILGRPVRLLLYSLALYAQVFLTWIVCSALVTATFAFAMRWYFAPESTDRLEHVTTFARDAHAAWMLMFTALGGGVVLSVFHSGSAVMYLLLRQANDGQDPADLWQPGFAERARAGRKAATERDDDIDDQGEGDDA